jgi:hypothetical protein
MAEMDFPLNPTVGQKYTNAAGVVYEWNGAAWIVGYLDTSSAFETVGDILDQVRIILQDTDVSSGEYRYSNDSIVQNINQGLLEMFKLRPDIFLETGFKVPTFNAAELGAEWPLELQWIPPIVYFTVGLTQVRDDEGTQDTRASAFLARFRGMLVTVDA